jgi:hypothetical protein
MNDTSKALLLCFIFFLALPACSDDAAPSGACAGSEVVCTCSSGGLSTACVDPATGIAGACQCGGAETGFETGAETGGEASIDPEAYSCDLGTGKPCSCPTGGTGISCPNEDGSFGACECESDITQTPCTEGLECPVDKPFCGVAGICLGCLGDTDCGANEFCLNGECKPILCVPNETTCNGNSKQTCNEDGTDFTLFACAPGSCTNGECVGCEPGIKVCEDGNVVQCKTDGSGYELTDVCDAAAQCIDGNCLVCFPGQGKCEGTDAWQCAPDGSDWVFNATCSESQLCISGVCQSACAGDIKFNTNVGCDYWAVDLDNGPVEAASASFAIVVSNTSDKVAEVSVRQADDGPVAASASIPPGGLQVLDLPPYNVDGSMIGPRAWKVTATAPIVAYQFNPKENELVYSNDASVLFPSNTWGKEYYVMSRFEIPTDSGTYRSFLTVVGGFNETEVTVTISPNAGSATLAGGGVPSLQPGESFTIVLNEYDVLNIESNGATSDLTGSHVTSDKPVGVFGGHECAVSGEQCCCDHLEQQIPPISAWGRTHIATRSMPRGVEKDYWRILASADNTQIITKPNQGFIPTLNAGQSWEIKSDKDFIIEANAPVLVAQILASSYEINGDCATGCKNGTVCDTSYQLCMDTVGICSGTGQGNCPGGHICLGIQCDGDFDCPIGFSCANGQCMDFFSGQVLRLCEPIGDPAMFLAVPMEQFRSEYIFLAPSNYLQDFLNVIAPVGTSIVLDDNQTLPMVPIPEACSATSGVCWAVAKVSLSDGTHSIASTGGEKFGIAVYGYDDDVSYGYPGGMALEALNN